MESEQLSVSCKIASVAMEAANFLALGRPLIWSGAIDLGKDEQRGVYVATLHRKGKLEGKGK